MPLKNLIIVRHAKSDWSSNIADDFNRPLSPRGEMDAPVIASWIAKNIEKPDCILSSPAMRAKQTALAIANAFGIHETQIELDEQIYLASLPTLINLISLFARTQSSILLVGHNPGLENLLLHLSKDTPPYTDSGKLLTTANVAHLKFENGQNFESRCCRLVNLIRPQDLIK